MKGFRLFLNSLLLFKSSHHLLICIPDLFISLSLPIIKKEKKAFSRAKTLKSWAHLNCWLVIILHVSPNCLDDVLTSSKLWQIALFIIETLQNNFQYGLGISQSIKETHSLFYVYLNQNFNEGFPYSYYSVLYSVPTDSANWLKEKVIKRRNQWVDNKVTDENFLHLI